MTNRFSLKGKCAIVTGVSSGLGIAFSEALAEAGANLVVCARREDKLKRHAKAIMRKFRGIKVIPVKADVTSDDDIAALIGAAVKGFGRIDILVNNAGIAVGGTTVGISRGEWERAIATNLTGSFMLAREVIKVMLKKHIKGSIVNVASIYGLGADIFPAVEYYATKGAVVNMTRAMAAEHAKDGIRVNAIAPGFFPSEMTEDVLNDKRVMNHVLTRTPMGRVGNPDELKGAVIFLASNASSYVTGHTLPVDGGWRAV